MRPQGLTLTLSPLSRAKGEGGTPPAAQPATASATMRW